MKTRLEISDGRAYAYTEYAGQLVEKFRDLGGKWDAKLGAWAFPAARERDLRPLFGNPVTGIVRVRVRVDQTAGYQHIYIGGYVLAGRRGRDNRADIYADLVAGEIPGSGGSVKHPGVKPSADAVWELDVPRDFAVAHDLEIVAATPSAEPPPISEGYRQNFATLLRAAGHDDLALVSAIRKADQRPVALVCAMQRNDDETIMPVPLAVMCEGNPFEDFEDPTCAPTNPAMASE